MFECPAKPVGLHTPNNLLMACLSPILPAAGWAVVVFHEGVRKAALWAGAALGSYTPVVHHLF